MQIARRAYLYLISGVTLAVLAAGTSMLLSILLEQLGLRSGDPFGEGNVRDRLSLAGALVGVALPVWGIHWWLVRRGVSAGSPSADVERGDGLRAFFLAAVMAVSLAFAAAAAANLVRLVVLALAGEGGQGFDAAGNVAVLLTAAVVWTYHARTRRDDLRHVVMSHSASWWPRLYRYAAAVIGLFVLLFGLASLIDLAVRIVAGPGTIGLEPGQSWWAFPLGDAVSRSVVGLALWVGHWSYSTRLAVQEDWRGESERHSALRTTAYVAVLLGSLVATIGFVGESAHALLAWLLGVQPGFGEPVAGDVAPTVAAPLLTATAFVGAWWLHRAWMMAEARRSDQPTAPERATRLDLGAAALVGVGFGAVAVAWLMGLLLDVVFGGTRVASASSGVWRDELATYAPLAIAGLAAWGWGWSGLQWRRGWDPEGELRSTVRRAYLLLVLAGSMIALVASLAVILYRLFGALLGADLPANLVSELSTPAGALIMAAALAAYHGLVLLRDLRDVAARPSAVDAAAAPVPEARLTLVLTGPADADLGSVLGNVRRQLPAGFSLEVDATATDG